MGSNGKTLYMDPLVIKADSPATSPVKPVNLNHFLVGCVPFTAVPFTGPDALIAFGRLAGFSLLAYWTYNKMRPASYAFMGAAGVALTTSLLAGWGKTPRQEIT